MLFTIVMRRWWNADVEMTAEDSSVNATKRECGKLKMSSNHSK